MKIFRVFTFSFITIYLAFVMSIFGASQKQFKLLIIDSQKGEPYKTVRESMLSELSKFGYKEGKNLIVKYHSIGNFEGRAINIWKKIESKKNYDVVFVNGTIAVKALKKVALDDSNKFVFAAVTDPVGVGVIDDFQNPPKYNFTGVCYPVKVEERLRFIKKVLPHVNKIALIYADMPQSDSYKKWVERGDARVKLACQYVKIRNNSYMLWIS